VEETCHPEGREVRAPKDLNVRPYSNSPGVGSYLPAPCTFTNNSANFAFRSAWSFPLSASANCVIFIEQNFGPHIEQNFASL